MQRCSHSQYMYQCPIMYIPCLGVVNSKLTVVEHFQQLSHVVA